MDEARNRTCAVQLEPDDELFAMGAQDVAQRIGATEADGFPSGRTRVLAQHDDELIRHKAARRYLGRQEFGQKGGRV